MSESYGDQSTDNDQMETKANPNLVGSAQAVQDRRASRFMNGNPEDARTPAMDTDWPTFNDEK